MLTSLAVLVGGCAGSATPGPSAPPTPRPAPVITPDPHLSDPADLDTIFTELTKGGLQITPINAGAAAEPLRRVNATYLDWPIILSEFSSSAALVKAIGWTPGVAPERGDAPYTIVGLNIMIEYGPKVTNAAKPEPPDPIYEAAAEAIVRILDPLLGPLGQRSVVPLPLPTASPPLDPAASVTPSPVPS